MVKHLLALITRRRDPVVDAANTESENNRLIKSVTQTLARLLNPPSHSNLESPSNQSPSPRSLTHVVTPENETSSPQRRRKNQPNIPSSSSPRKGADSKRRRSNRASIVNEEGGDYNNLHDAIVVDWNHHVMHGFGIHGKPTTDFDGWRRLWLGEICRIMPGSFVLLCIPPKRRRQLHNNAIRKRVLKRIMDAIKRASVDSFNHASSFDNQATVLMYQQNSITRNGDTYLEFPCVIKHYPHRDEYIRQSLSLDEVEQHLKQNGGLDITLLDYQSHKPLLIEWRDMQFVQMFVQRNRGESRPTPHLNERSALHFYAKDFASIMDQIEDDTVAMNELALQFEKARARHNSRSSTIIPNHDCMTKYLYVVKKQEMKPDRIRSFAEEVDLLYEDAWFNAYSGFTTFGGGILDGDSAARTVEIIIERFPYIYGSLELIVFGERADNSKPFFALKRVALCNKFLALLRVRDPTYLPNWAMVCSLAMWASGVAAKHIKNPMITAYTIGRYIFLERLHKIYTDTIGSRRRVLQSQKYLHSSLDNYNQHHAVMSRDEHGSIYHTGMVYNAVQPISYRIPKGSRILYNNGSRRVMYFVESSRIINAWSCEVVLNENNNQQSIKVTLPHLYYDILSMPRDPGPCELVYLDQEEFIPRSVRQLIPKSVSLKDLLMTKREWMKNPDHVTSLPHKEVSDFSPLQHYQMLKAMQRVKLIFRFNDWLAGSRVNPSDSELDPTTTLALMQLSDMIAYDKEERGESLRHNVQEYQRDILRHWNESYDAVSRLMFFPISPREEMTNEEAMLAAIHVMEDLGFLEKVDDSSYKLGKDVSRRLVFQYGDVFTIQKWYTLGFHILRKMTHIGREDYVSIIMTAYDRFIKIQDYLHENIHRLDAIFKIYYGDILQPIQYMIGTKKVGPKPSKGSWGSHELLIQKVHFGAERLFMESFMDNVGNEIISGWDCSDLSGLMWKLQEEMEAYLIELEDCRDEVTRAFVLLMKYTYDWLLARDGIPVGDWCVHDVLGCKWISFWAATKKHGYLLETKRRIETVFQLPWHELEYLRMGRFVRLQEGSRFISYDDLCEKQNFLVKRCPKNNNLDVVVKTSRHLLPGQKCRNELMGKGRRNNRPSMEGDILKVYELLKTAGVFQNPNKIREIEANSIWKHVRKRGKLSPAKWHTHKEKVNTTSHEKKALQILFNKNELTNVSQTPSREVNETASANSSHSEESSESLVESIASLESDNRSVNTDATEEALNEWAQEAANEIDDIMMTVGDFGAETDMTNNEIHERARKLVMEDSVEENNTITFLDKPKDQDEMLKKNNSQRRDLNRNCIKNQFEVGRKKLKNIVKERQLERSKLERKVKVIYDSVAFFRKHQEKEMTNLDDRTNSIEADQAKEPKSWETGLATTLSMFDVTAYRNESNN